MATAVLRCGHVFSTIHMPTLEYQREHGTPSEKVIGPALLANPCLR